MSLGAQEPEAPASSPPEAAESSPPPREFRNLSLGMSLEDLKGALEKDSLFHFRGDRDVSSLPAREESLVEASGSSFVGRAFFQLREGKVFVMSFTLNPALVDHYSVFSSFVEKYGEPGSFSPREAVWETSDTRVSLERPLTVKYIDKTVFNDILDESRAEKSGALKKREDFLHGF